MPLSVKCISKLAKALIVKSFLACGKESVVYLKFIVDMFDIARVKVSHSLGQP